MSQSKNQERDALLTELNRLQLSKLNLLDIASQEIEKLRVFIKVLGKIDQEKQNVSSKSLQEIEKFNMPSNINDGKTHHQHQNNNLLNIYKQYYSSLNISDIQKEIEILHNSKLDLILSINTEINDMRHAIKALMYSILNPQKYTEKDLLAEFEVNWKLMTSRNPYKDTFFRQIIPVRLFLDALNNSNKLLNQLIDCVVLNKAQTKLLISGFMNATLLTSKDIVNLISKFLDEIIMIDGRTDVDIESNKMNDININRLEFKEESRNKVDKLMLLRVLDISLEWHTEENDMRMIVKKKCAIKAIKKVLKRQQPSLPKYGPFDKYVHVSDWYIHWKPYIYPVHDSLLLIVEYDKTDLSAWFA